MSIKRVLDSMARKAVNAIGAPVVCDNDEDARLALDRYLTIYEMEKAIEKERKALFAPWKDDMKEAEKQSKNVEVYLKIQRKLQEAYYEKYVLDKKKSLAEGAANNAVVYGVEGVLETQSASAKCKSVMEVVEVDIDLLLSAIAEKELPIEMLKIDDVFLAKYVKVYVNSVGMEYLKKRGITISEKIKIVARLKKRRSEHD